MKKRLLVLLFSLASLALVSCGGGNDVASSGTTAVSAAAPATNTSPASTPSTAATEPKVNGQVDEQTGVAPVAAQMTVWTPYLNGGRGNSSSFGGTGPALTNAQNRACFLAFLASTNTQCSALGWGNFSSFISMGGGVSLTGTQC